MKDFRRFTIYFEPETWQDLEEMAWRCGCNKSDLVRGFVRAAKIQFESYRKAHPDLPISIPTLANNVHNDVKLKWLAPWYDPDWIQRRIADQKAIREKHPEWAKSEET